jgi:hypothetical protein
LVFVPINVQVPPNNVAYDNGIRNFEGAKLRNRHHDFTTGINIATIGVLFKNAETPATGDINLNNFIDIEPGFCPNSIFATEDKAPVDCKAYATTYKNPIESTAGLLKPRNASLTEITPPNINKIRAVNKVISDFKNSNTNEIIIKTKTTIVYQNAKSNI